MSKTSTRPTPHQPPQELRRFLELFDEARFWDSHEVLEVPWRRNRSGFYKGLILYASAFVHVQRGNRRGVAAQLRKTLRELAPYRPAHLGIDVDSIISHSERVLASLAESGAEPDLLELLPPPLRFRPEICRGDEAELQEST